MCTTTEMRSWTRQQRADQTIKQTRPDQRKPQRAGRVADLITWSISIVSPDTGLAEALHLVTAMNPKVLAVYEGKHYVGFVAPSVLMDAMEAMGPRSPHVRIREIMISAIPPCLIHDSIHEVRNRMRQSGVTDLPVLDANGKVAGVLSVSADQECVPNMGSTDALHISI